LQEGQQPPAKAPRRRKGGKRDRGHQAQTLRAALATPKTARRVTWIMAIVAIGFVAFAWQDVAGQINGYGDLSIGETPDEIMYSEGKPNTVQRTAAATSSADAQWTYSSDGKSFGIRFTGGVASEFICPLTPETVADCPSTFGIVNGTPESIVIQRLGIPGGEALRDGRKTVDYADLGVSFLMERGEVRQTVVRRATGGGLSPFGRLVRIMLP
jgi:hypothetical protein